MRYALKMRSEEFGYEEFGPYDTMDDALLAQKRILVEAEKLNDGVERAFEITAVPDMGKEGEGK